MRVYGTRYQCHNANIERLRDQRDEDRTKEHKNAQHRGEARKVKNKMLLVLSFLALLHSPVRGKDDAGYEYPTRSRGKRWAVGNMACEPASQRAGVVYVPRWKG